MTEDMMKTRDQHISLLKNVQGFDALNNDVLIQIAETTVLQQVSRGEVLIEQGGPADNLYIVLKGRFVVLVDGAMIAEIPTGEPIGELAFFAGGTRTASVIAARNSTVMRLTRQDYDRLSEKRQNCRAVFWRRFLNGWPRL